jgi:DNA-binding transcriptional regulator YiaG
METNHPIYSTEIHPEKALDGHTASESGFDLSPTEFRRCRKAVGRTQADVAAKCGCSASLIGKWEKGKCGISPEVVPVLMAIWRDWCVSLECIDDSAQRCSRCEEHLPLELFNRDASKKSGIQSLCMPCSRQSAFEWYQKYRLLDADTRLIKRIMRASRERLAGCKWVSDRDRDIEQLRNLGAEPGQFRVGTKPSNCQPRNVDFGDWKNAPTAYKKNRDITKSATQLLSSGADFVSVEAHEDYSWYDEMSEKLTDLLQQGRVTEEQVNRLVRLICR